MTNELAGRVALITGASKGIGVGIATAFGHAGVFDNRALADIDEIHFHHIYDSNVLGLLTTTRFAVANFNHTGGSVINISSLSAVGNAPGRAVYASSKAAVNAMAQSPGPRTGREQ